MRIYQSSSRVALWKHSTVHTRMKKDVNSMNMAPVSIRPACLRIAGIARLPMADAPVRNFAALIHPPPSLLVKKCVDPPPKNRHGIGTRTYMRAANMGHQLLYRAHASICSRMLVENINASPASTSTVIAMFARSFSSSPASSASFRCLLPTRETGKRAPLNVIGPPVRVRQIPLLSLLGFWALGAAVRVEGGRVVLVITKQQAAAAEEEEMTRLTVEQAAREAGSDGSGATALNLSHRALSDVSCLSSFIKLERLDLGYSCLVTLEGLSSCANLKWLSVIENKLVSLKGVEGLSKLQVLNAGKNKLTKMDEVASLTSLGALILNDNNISSICKLDQLQQLNTLVLSKNPIFTIGNALAKAKSMKKLSLSHCQIENIGSSLAACVELKELRLSHNKITTIPSDLAKNVKMLNLDLGNNLIERSSDLKVLSELRYLRNLNLQGNPISETDSLIKKVKKFVPNLRILNAKPLEASSKSDKSYGKENLRDKSYGKENLPSKDDPVEIDRKKKDKRQQTKQQLKGPEEPGVRTISPAVTTSAIAKYEVLDGKERKKDRKESKKSEVEEHANDSKSKRKDDVDDTRRKDKKDAKRKKFVDEEDIDAEGIDNTEISFADLVFSKQYSSEPKPKDSSTQEVAPSGKSGDLVIDHTKKRKKSKGAVTITDSSALKMISSVPDVGAGGLGLSSWDD